MKKVTLTLLSAAMFSLVACGPSAEEKAAQAKHEADSIAAIESARIQDSIATAQKATEDSLATVAAAAKATADSIATADSLAAAAKAAVKQSPAKPKVKATTKPVAAKATLTDEEKKLPAKVQEKILKKRQEMMDNAAKK